MTNQGSKLRSRWDGPFVITNVFPYGAVELKDEHTNRPNTNYRRLGDHFTNGTSPASWCSLSQLPQSLSGTKGEASQSLVIPVTWDVECIYKPKHSRGRENIVLRKNSATLGRPLILGESSRPTDSFSASRLNGPAACEETTQQPNKERPNCVIHVSNLAQRPSQLQLNCHVTLGESTMSETEKLKIVRGDRLDYQRTLVDPILNVLANGELVRLCCICQHLAETVSDKSLSRTYQTKLYREKLDLQPRVSLHSTLKFCFI
ncbi:hypothetical protein CR513_42175, partial [Mucuna pruriens]